MKKSVFIILMAAFLTKAYAQDPELYNHTWFVHSIIENGQTTEAPHNPEMTVSVLFDSNFFNSDLCCAGTLDMGLDFDTSQPTFEITDLAVTPDDCDEPDNNDFRNMFTGFFQNAVANSFTYSITSPPSWWGLQSLIITNNLGDEVQLYNTPHLIENYNPYLDEGNTTLWFLYSMKIGSESYTYGQGDEEFDYITAEFMPDGTFYTKVCSELIGQATFTDIWDGNFNHLCYINCSKLEQSTDVCSLPESANIENLYMSFFSENADSFLKYQLNIADKNGGDGYGLWIEAPSGDFLSFVSDLWGVSINGYDWFPVKLYPNPANDNLYLEVPDGLDIQTLSLLDIHGRVVKTYPANQRELDISGRAAGQYFLEIRTGEGKVSKKVVIER